MPKLTKRTVDTTEIGPSDYVVWHDELLQPLRLCAQSRFQEVGTRTFPTRADTGSKGYSTLSSIVGSLLPKRRVANLTLNGTDARPGSRLSHRGC